MSDERVCIVGIGYVGLPLAVAFDEAGVEVIGYDIDSRKIEHLQADTDPTGEIGDAAIAASNVRFTADPTAINDAAYVIITVPTPIDRYRTPNLSHIEAAAETVGQQMAVGTTVVLESTVFPGMTREVLVPKLEAASGLTVGEGFRVGYSPERVSPGDDGHGVKDVIKLVSGQDEGTREDLARLYGQIVDAGVHPAPDIETAEAAKVIENVQRDVNIALVNELAMICHHLDLDTHQVLEAAGTKWNFHDEYRPGLVGGHCIPVDPMYLVYQSRMNRFVPRLILQAREINEYVPTHTAELTVKKLNQVGNVLQDSQVLVLGLAYKPNSSDIRTSQASVVIDELEEFNVEVVGYDPHADDEEMRATFDIEIQDELSYAGFDGIILATPHDEFRDLDLEAMAAGLNDSPVIVDVMGVLDPTAVSENGFAYQRL